MLMKHAMIRHLNHIPGTFTAHWIYIYQQFPWQYLLCTISNGKICLNNNFLSSIFPLPSSFNEKLKSSNGGLSKSIIPKLNAVANKIIHESDSLSAYLVAKKQNNRQNIMTAKTGDNYLIPDRSVLKTYHLFSNRECTQSFGETSFVG